MPRPCPFVGCRYHLFLEVTYSGSISLPWGEDPAAIASMPDTCALDVAERGATRMQYLANLFRVTHMQARNIGHSALARMALESGVAEAAPPGAEPAYAAERFAFRYNYPDKWTDVARRRRRAAAKFAAEPADE